MVQRFSKESFGKNPQKGWLKISKTIKITTKTH